MNKKGYFSTLFIFLLGIFMGAIDSGIVSPARTVIQNSFGVTENIGVWMITIYTLAYAVSMPIVSKLSDLYGRKKVYTTSIITFAIGSTLCGLTNFYGNFTLMLISRVIQALGAGGIMPIATAVIGSSFPKEKRGTALGLVGAIYGVATMLGPTIGSTILNISGVDHWGYIFFINVPISILIIILGSNMKESIAEVSSKLDLKGSAVLSILILSLMYALTNLNFFHFKDSITKSNVWPYLLVFIISLPFLIIIENNAEDPVINLKYFETKEITLTLIIGFITGVGLMGVVFVPQFAENTLKIQSGKGGYLVTLMSIFAGVSAPVGGKLVDKYSAKLILGTGFTCSAIGSLILGLYASTHTSFIPVLIGLAFIGFGMGFTMGTPLNYLMLNYVSEKESVTALSTLSLIRSIGVTISPNIMINFIAEAGRQIPDKLKAALPPLQMPTAPGMSNIPSNMPKVDMMGNLSPEALKTLMSADVTNIVDRTKDFMASILDKIIPNIKAFAINAINKSMENGAAPNGSINSATNSSPMDPNAIQIAVTKSLENWKLNYLDLIESKRQSLEQVFQSTLNIGFKNMFVAAAIIAIIGLLITLLLSNKKKVKLLD